jgi:hypothetical protein
MSNIKQLLENGNDSQVFILPGMAEVSTEFTDEDLADDMEGIHLSFQRIKIPSGGTLQFEIPGDDPERPGYTAFIEGVILYSHPSNAYWPDGSYDEDMATPACSSSDNITGHGDPGGACAVCPLNQWGTGTNGKGKACKNMRQMYILRSGECMPIQLTLAPTSIKPYNDFFNTVFAARRRATFGSVVRIGLKRMSNGKDDYSVATFQKVSDFVGEELVQIREYAICFKNQIKYMQNQRVFVTGVEEGYSEVPGADLEPLYQMPPGNDGYIPQYQETVIDGERERLPA